MYIFIEMQTSGEQTAIPPAVSEFHRLCSVAAVSSVPIHTIVMLDEHGETLLSEHFEHEEAK